MRTVQLVPAMEQGGVERGIVEMNRVIVAAGWENIVVSVGGRMAANIVADGGLHIKSDIKSKNPFTYFRRASALEKLLRELRPDVVCAHSRVPAWLFVRANRRLHIPWITFAHGANSVSWYSRIMTAGDLTVTPSEYIADYLIKAYGISRTKLRVIPRAIDRDRFDVECLDGAFVAAKREEWGLGGSETVIMGVGRISRLKGYDVLIRAVHLLNQESGERRYRLVIVGEAEAIRKDVERDLHALVAELGVADQVVFAGNQSKVAECLSLADIVVSANTTKPEAFGRSMAEALAMDKPVVARAFGGALDVVRDGIDGVLVRADGGTAADWARRFADAIAKAAATKFSGLRASALDRFSFDRMAQSSLSVYREVTSKPPQPR